MQNLVKTVRGIVYATAQNTSRIGRVWYDGFGSCPVERGADVEVDFVEDDRFRNVQEVRIVEAEAPRREARDCSADRRVARAVALTCAATLHAAG